MTVLAAVDVIADLYGAARSLLQARRGPHLLLFLYRGKLRIDAVGEILSTRILCEKSYATRNIAKGERLVFASEVSSIHVKARIILIAVAVNICCKCVFANPL
jgi:hypothetical protein